MKHLVVFSFLLLTGCGYDYNELNAAKAACANISGKFSVGTTGSVITTTYCSVDGVKYRIGRTSYELFEGEQE